MGFFDGLMREVLSGGNSLESQLKEYWGECNRNWNMARDIAQSNCANSHRKFVCKAFMLYVNFKEGFDKLSPFIPKYLQEYAQADNVFVLIDLLICVYDMTIPVAKAFLRLIRYDDAFISCLKNWQDFHSVEKLKQELLFQQNLIRANNQVRETEEKERVDALIEQYKNLSSKEIEKLIEETATCSYEREALNNLLVEIKRREEKEEKEKNENAKANALAKLRSIYNGYTYDDLLRYLQFLTDPFEKAAAQILLAEKLEEKRTKLSGEINQKYQNASLESLIHAEAISVDPVEKEMLSAILNERKQSNLLEFMHIKYDDLSLKELVKAASQNDLLPAEKDYLARLLSQKMK